jgi:hypothetical protein
VIAVVSEFKDIEGKDNLFSLNLPTNSVARWEDSLALPPFPQKNTVFPEFRVFENKSEAFFNSSLFWLRVSRR